MADFYSLYSGAALTASGSGPAIAVPAGTNLAVVVSATAVSGTTPSATFEIQWSNDGTNWASADGTADSFAALTAAGSLAKNITAKGQMMRLKWTISGTTPSFTTTASVIGLVVHVSS